jgi:hypothetical protein
MKKIMNLLWLAMAIHQPVFSQSELPKYGEFTREEIEMKECSFDKNADAVILFDEGYSYYDDEYRLVTSRRTRIKILNARAGNRGDIIIPFYSKDNFESIQNVDGISFNPGSSPERSYLNRKSVYTEKVNDHLSKIKFAIPNVKPGTILEYKYESIMKHYGGLDQWVFQSDLPTMKSCYLLQIIPNAVFNYVLFKKNEYTAHVIPKSDLGQIYYEMDNIPGLNFEAYMDSPRDYFQKVQFQLSSYMTQYGTTKKVYVNWEDISKTLSNEDMLGGTLKKNLAVPGELQLAVMQQTTNAGKIKTVYNYVNTYFSPNGYDSKYATENLKKIIDKRTGTNGEINLVLINYLRSFDIEAYPLIAADRDFGAIDPRYALVDRFNKTVAYVVDGEKTYVLDATENHLPTELIPYSLLNTYALLIDKKKGMLMKINSSGIYNSEINIAAKISAEGLLEGKAEINSYEYAKQAQATAILADKNKYVTDQIESKNAGLKVTSLKYDYNQDIEKPFVQQIQFQKTDVENGGFILLDYNLFSGLTVNPFKARDRFTNVNFGYPYHIIVNETIELPKGALTDNLLKNKTIQSANKDIQVSRIISREENKLKISIDFQQSVTLVPVDSYPALRDFYKEVIDMLHEPVVIKVKP